MSAPKHTPGPWEFRVYAGGCIIVSKHDAPGRSVRDWLKGVSVIVDAQIDDDQGNAHEASPDAHLIAAAPELLKALKDLEGSFEKHRPKSMWDAARAAIAKAEGTGA